MAFTYVLLVLIIALGAPLTVNLQRRATAELETQALIQAQGIAVAIGAENVDPERRADLIGLVDQAAAQVAGRVVVVDRNGILLADSDRADPVGELFDPQARPEMQSALAGTPESFIRFSADLGQDIMATAVPIQDEDRLVGVVRITTSIQQVRANVRRITLGLLAIGGAGLLAGLLIAFGLAGSLSRPLTRLADAARRLGEGDLSARAGQIGGASEIEQLGDSFDEMADRLERTVQAQREFVANASHQLRTPLTGMKLRLESSLASVGSDEIRRQLEAADREVDRLAEIVDRLLVMAQEIEEGRPTHVDVGDAIGRAIMRWNDRATHRKTTLLGSGPGGEAQGNPADLDQILDNLLDNAIAYAPGEVMIESGRTDGRVFVAVQDRGPGIPADEIVRVTERFYRGREAPAGGSGLGLAIARQLAEKWGGELRIAPRDGGGTRVEVRLRPGGG